ncbi:hypothetical protein [Cognatiyoonia sp. IB215182]|uniref:hypothetical protein n=1 Tax=Cognatiyoonia sp. IB215182 TaxID=3097353 RepID=UPI002A0AB44B|nr:hypothetical protein [Cognatiyoonia sp. IB215182]MDX8351858.1 hypothetical protein [Cognatiyoonia sp. IB215182]
MSMTWFEELTGITDETSAQVYETLSLSGTTLTSSRTGWQAEAGTLSIPSLFELRNTVSGDVEGVTTLQEVVADVQHLHMRPENEGATFQVASQFNLLEMLDPGVTPEMGVARYEHDHTQGPACAVACLAGTIYRNYFVPFDGGVGQTATRQIDCLADIGALLGPGLWEMRNGYALPTLESLHQINALIAEMDADNLRAALRVGVHRDTQVTTNDAGRLVTQVYCSATPVAYVGIEAALWSPFAQMILEAAYEATFLAAVQNAARTGNRRLFLTLLGGGAFGNRSDWIAAGLLRALRLHAQSGLDVHIVSYGQSNALARSIIADFDG